MEPQLLNRVLRALARAAFSTFNVRIAPDPARLINAIPTHGYGGTFDWSGNRLSFNTTHRSFVQSEFNWRGRIADLEEHGMVSGR